jgi:hypothetical protein
MNCPQCSMLSANLDSRQRDYISARVVLHSAKEAVNPNWRQRLKIAAENCRVDYELARVAFEQHRNVHTKAN